MSKRLFDIILSAVGLMLIWPILLVVAVWIKLDSDGPVFYRQVRVGRNLLYVLRIIFKTFYVIFRGY